MLGKSHSFGSLSHAGQNYWMLISWDREHFFLNNEGTFGNQKGLISWCWLGLFAVCGNDYRLQLNRMKPCNLFNCILRIKRSLNLLVSYAYFDICGGIKRASSRGYSTRMQFPQTFCPTCDKQVISSTSGQLRINFTCIFKAFPKFWEIFENMREINPSLPTGPCNFIYKAKP